MQNIMKETATLIVGSLGSAIADLATNGKPDAGGAADSIAYALLDLIAHVEDSRLSEILAAAKKETARRESGDNR